MELDSDDLFVLIVTIGLLVCMIWDTALGIVKVYIRVPSRIHNLLVLNSLTLSFLQAIDINIVNTAKGFDLETMVRTQWRTDAARLTVCIFVGCILPGMTRPETKGGWSYLANLFLSFLFHIASEIYALRNQGRGAGPSLFSGLWPVPSKRESVPWLVSSAVILSLGASSLLILLGAVILISQMQRRLVRTDISNEEKYECGRREILRNVGTLWMRVYIRRTEYFARISAFIQGSGMIVTVCVILIGAKVACRLASPDQYTKHGLTLTFYVQWTFILVGWIVMLFRWFKTALYCGNCLHLNRGFFMDIALSFLAPVLIVVNLLCPSLVLKAASFLSDQEFSLRSILISASCLVPLLPLCVFFLAVSLLWPFCYICWYFSALLFGRQIFQRICQFDNVGLSRDKEYMVYRSIMNHMTKESKERTDFFWIVNKKSLYKIKEIVQKQRKIGQNCTGLLSLMGDTRLDENQRLRLHVRNRQEWMEAVSRIFSSIADAEISVDLENALKAYRETEDVLKFVDHPNDILLDPLNIFGTMNINIFFKSPAYKTKMFDVKRKLKQLSATSAGKKREKGELKLTSDEHNRVDNLLRVLNRLGEEIFDSALITPNECSYDNVDELSDILGKLVGRVIASGLLDASDMLLKCTKQWVQNLDEPEGIDLAAKVSTLLENLVENGDIHSKETVRAQTENGEPDAKFAEAAWEWCSTRA